MNDLTKTENKIEIEGEETLNQHSSEDYPHISIKMTKEQFSVFDLKRQYEKRYTLEIDPDFQREKGVWTTQQKSELIESILMGIPIPIIYFFENEKGFKQVVDGRQRLSCLFDFLDGKFKLTHLNLLATENGRGFKELSSQLQAKIEDYQFLAYTIQHPTPERVKFDIFDRVNRGGTQLNNQEMRNALYLGKSTKLLNRLAKSENFLSATGKTVSKKRMKDKYIILRFLGFYLLHTKKLDEISYKSNVDEFLAEVMKYINKLTNNRIEFLSNIFELSMKNCFDILGKDAFRFDSSSENYRVRRPTNMGLFESLGYLLSIPLSEKVDKLALKKEIELLKQEMDKSQMFTGVIDTSKGVNYRFYKANNIRTRLESAK